jgi:hypothetical protein
MRSKFDEALDGADRLLEAAARRKDAPESEPPSSEWDMDTAKHRIEELEMAVEQAAARAKEPSQPHIEINFPKDPRHSSAPPSSKGRNTKLFGIAAVITALGGGTFVQQCASRAEERVRHHAPTTARP